MRLPAVVTTFCIELIVAFVFSNFTDTFRQYPLLIGFQPVISAISGNVGLQSSTVNVRALSAGLVTERRVCHGMSRELTTGIMLALITAVISAITALVWYCPLVTGEGHTWSGSWAFALAIGLGQTISIITAATSGSMAPLVFKRCGFDPASMAGPMETAIQDVVGGTLLLALSAAILSHFGDFAAECPEGGMTECIKTWSYLGPGEYNVTRIDICLQYQSQGIC